MASIPTFTVGQEYRRSELHDQYGGSRQGGISPSAKHTLMSLFTGESGKQYGYEDGFQEDGTYWYTGEGRKGDMRMTKGNAAIRDSAANGRQLHLFEQTQKGFVRYLGECSYLDYRWEIGPDEDQNVRKVIVFELEVIPKGLDAAPVLPVSPVQSKRPNLWKLSLDELRARAHGSFSDDQPLAERKRRVYLRSEAVRVYVLRRAGGTCEACECKAPFGTPEGRPYLEPHHIRRRADGGPDNPAWVAALCPNCHRRVHCGEDGQTYNETIAYRVRAIEGHAS